MSTLTRQSKRKAETKNVVASGPVLTVDISEIAVHRYRVTAGSWHDGPKTALHVFSEHGGPRRADVPWEFWSRLLREVRRTLRAVQPNMEKHIPALTELELFVEYRYGRCEAERVLKEAVETARGFGLDDAEIRAILRVRP